MDRASVCGVSKQNDISIALIDATGVVLRPTTSLQEQFSCFDNSTQFECCHQYSALGTTDYLNFVPTNRNLISFVCQLIWQLVSLRTISNNTHVEKC